ncbi:GntR family transcriptional regulator [Vreelandella sp. EE22]
MRVLPQTPAVEDSDNPWPKHHRVYLVLRQEILDGAYPVNQSLPNEIALAQNFGVSRITVRKAMERLNREGLVERFRGKGTFPVTTEDSPIQASISGVIENLIAMGLSTNVEVIDFDYMKANQDIADTLQLLKDNLVQKTVRIRSHLGVPFSLLTTYVPESIGRTYSKEDLATQPLLLLLANAEVKVAHARQTITAKLATPDQAKLLKIQPGEALLRIRRVVFDEEGIPVEYIEGFYCPGTYEHEVSLGIKMHNDQRLWDT